MPSTVAHALTSFALGLSLHIATRAAFSPLRIFLLVLHSTNGPDIGSLVEFLLSPLLPSLGTFIMQIVHHPIGYPLTMGWLSAHVGVWLDAREIRWVRGDGGADVGEWRGLRNLRVVRCDGVGDERHEAVAGEEDDQTDEASHSLATDIESPTSLPPPHPRAPLTLPQSLALTVAGSLLHFRLDTLYEDAGETPLYRWIISTGYWGPGANDVIYTSVSIAFVAALSSLLGTLVVVYSPTLRNALPGAIPLLSPPTRLTLRKGLATPKGRATLCAGVALLVATTYWLFVAYRLYLTPPRADGTRVPAVGEEADFGVIGFEAVTGVAPLALALWSCGVEL
ncbi:uncharacterized protein EV422DRAFT_523958, partial [Fimicolochytrium jonesii]|uniref:uncharacterized protein n=1 Tax=Fimicolochytrium jonesii TaxID=1396493 RepID=UPI0022FE2D72